MSSLSSPVDLDGFLPLLTTSDTKMKLSIGTKLHNFLTNPKNSVECTDIGLFIDTLVIWLQNSNFKIVLNGLEILTEFVERLRHDFHTYLPSVLPPLVDKLGDSKEIIRDKTIYLLMKIISKGVISAQNLFDKIGVAGFTHKHNNVRETTLKLLTEVLREYGSTSITISKFVPYISKLLSDPHLSVRTAAFNTLVDIYKHVGDKLKIDLQKKQSIPPSKLAALMKEFDNIKSSDNLLSDEMGAMSLGDDKTDFVVDRKLDSCSKRPPVTPNGPNVVVKSSLKMSSLKKPPPNVPAGAIDEKAFSEAYEDVPEVNIYCWRDVDDFIRKSVATLNNTVEDWNKRVDQLKKIRSMVVAGASQYEEFCVCMNQLIPPFEVSLKDLRSQVVRETCITLAFLSEKLKQKFDHYAESLLNTLMNLIQNSAKIIASSALICIRIVLKNTHTSRLLPIIISNMSSKSKEIRRASCEFLTLILQSWPPHCVEKHVLMIQDAVKRGIADADGEARAFSRKSFWEFKKHFPQLADTLLLSLDNVHKKLLISGSSNDLSSITTHQPRTSTVFKTPVNRQQTTPQFSLRSNSAIDLQAAKRANVRAQYAALAREKVGSVTSLPRGKKMVPTSPIPASADMRGGRMRSRISMSQPTSRSGSPSSRLANYGYAGANGSKGRKVIPRSTDTSRESSPTRFGFMSPRSRPPIQPTCKPLLSQKILQQSQEAETALADALGSGNNWSEYTLSRMSPRKAFRSLDEHSDESETSSICSERSLTSRSLADSFSWNGTHRTQRDLSEMSVHQIISNCESPHWNDRKEGLIALQYYIQAGNLLALPELKHIMDVFAKIFNDPHTKVISLFLDTLNELIASHHRDMEFCLYLLLNRLLNKLGGDILTSTRTKITKTLNAVLTSFKADLQIKLILKFLTDPTQTPNTKVKVETLSYLIELTKKADPSLALGWVNNDNDHSKVIAMNALEKIVAWMMNDNMKQRPELVKISEQTIMALFSLNTAQVTFMFSQLPKHYQEAVADVIKNGCQKSRSESPFHFKSAYSNRPLASTPNHSSSLTRVQRRLSESMDDQPTSGVTDDAYKPYRCSQEFRKFDDFISSINAARNGNGIGQSADDGRIGDSADTASNNSEVLLKIIRNLSENDNLSADFKTSNLSKISNIVKDVPSDTIMTNFKPLLKCISDRISDSDASVKEAALNALHAMVKKKTLSSCFKEYLELVVLKVLSASRDDSKDVQKAATSCAMSLSTHLCPDPVAKMIIPLIVSDDYPINLLVIKMLTRLIECSNENASYEHLSEIMNGLLIAYDNSDSSVRKSSVFCIVALYKKLGEETLAPYINCLSGAKLKLLQLYIRRAQPSNSQPITP